MKTAIEVRIDEKRALLIVFYSDGSSKSFNPEYFGITLWEAVKMSHEELLEVVNI
jgi:hypothetical protein